MKKIGPFEKELLFKTKISEITSISLEHTLNMKEDSIISGEFHINGEYKMTETSINKEPFDFVIPFDIALDSRFDIDSITLDIDDFYYEIINNEILKISIDIVVDGAEIKEELVRDVIPEEKEKVVLPIIEENNEIIDSTVERCIDDEKTENINNNINFLDNMSNNETYKTYKVYVVKDNDNIDSILTKYDITKEELENYNTIVDLKPGDKIIIPSSNE